MKEMFIIWLCMLFVIQKAKCLSLNVMPKLIEPGTTEKLLVNCSLNVARTPNLVFLNSLILSRSVDINNSDYQVVASINSVDGRVNVYDVDGVGSGVISNKGESYLSVQWAYPVYEMAGTYICEANGMSLTWKPQTFSVTTEISSSQLSQSSMAQFLRSTKLENIQRHEEVNQLTEAIKILTQKNKILENNVTLSMDVINNLKEKDKIAVKTLFYESELYNGHQYYLTKKSAIFSYSLAHFTCATYGGYLAEIDNEEEFNFVRKFLKNYASLYGVLISGSDEMYEGYWTNLRNNTELKYTKWISGEPNGRRTENCIIMLKDYNWFMNDANCNLYNNDLIGYLCEDFAL